MVYIYIYREREKKIFFIYILISFRTHRLEKLTWKNKVQKEREKERKKNERKKERKKERAHYIKKERKLVWWEFTGKEKGCKEVE